MPVYEFDCKAFLIVKVRAETEAEARVLLEDQVCRLELESDPPPGITVGVMVGSISLTLRSRLK